MTNTKCRIDYAKSNVKWDIEFWPKWNAIISGIPTPVRTFNPNSRPDFALKSRIQGFTYGKIPKNVLDTSFCYAVAIIWPVTGQGFQNTK